MCTFADLVIPLNKHAVHSSTLGGQGPDNSLLAFINGELQKKMHNKFLVQHEIIPYCFSVARFLLPSGAHQPMIIYAIVFVYCVVGVLDLQG